MAFTLLMILALLSLCGCGRQYYRQRADRAAYQLIESRLIDPRWELPPRMVEPDARSRHSLPVAPDCQVLPCDDPAANLWMRHPYRFHNHRYWDQLPTAEVTENEAWVTYLPRDSQGRVPLSLDLSLDLALLHSREFQTQYEHVYLTALALTGNRFEFDTQWAGGTEADFSATGDGASASRLLTLSDRLGFERQMAAGGQFATNIVNAFAFELGPNGFQQAGGAIVAAFTMPLLRGACRHVRLEGLTQAERDLLYQVRQFARFRREFYFEVVSRYYNLLAQVQSIKNLRANLDSLELNLQEHEELFERKMVAQIQVDQVFQDYQSGRINLFSAEQALANALDSFKFLLGLPPWLDLELDESLLTAFEFAGSDVQRLDAEVQALYTDMLNFLPPDDLPDREIMLRWIEDAEALAATVSTLLPNMRAELDRWSSDLQQRPAAHLSVDDRFDVALQKRVRDDLQLRLDEVHEAIQDWSTKTWKQDILRLVDHGDMALAWRQLLERIGRELQEHVNDLYLAQSQVRLFSIELESLEVQPAEAVRFAQANRLDIMNERARVVDAFRRVEVTANALQSQLDLSGQATIATDPTKDNAFRIDSSANSYRLGVRLDGPLNRLNERNAFRAAEIAYQQSRRQLLSIEDSVAAAVRADLRALDISRLNFQIARQQYVAVTRQVDEAKFNLRTSNQANSNLTRDLLTSLQGLLAAKNNLISNWIDYKTAKIRLFVDLELLYLDDRGKWINEKSGLDQLDSGRVTLDAGRLNPSMPQFWSSPSGEAMETETDEGNWDDDHPTEISIRGPQKAFPGRDEQWVRDSREPACGWCYWRWPLAVAI